MWNQVVTLDSENQNSMLSKTVAFTSLNRIIRKARRLDRDLHEIRMILFSDHHRGKRDHSDDFVQCEATYIAALNHYSKEQFELVLLGDVDELWENKVQDVGDDYEEVMQLERQFYLQDQIHRIWGNHDDYWREPILFDRYMGLYFKGLKIEEGLALNITKEGKRLGEIALVHGHQGSLGSDRFSTISRFFVRVFWRRWQNLIGHKLSSPAANLRIRSKTDRVMYEWASKRSGTILICGHTHQPIFTSKSHLDRLQELEELQDLSQANTKLLDTKKAEQTNVKVKGVRKPCYFNTGCCSFSDGDITGIEIIDGFIRLVRWDAKNLERTVLIQSPLESVFEECI